MNVFYFVNRWPRYNLSAQSDKILSNIQTFLNIGYQVSIFSADTAPEENLVDLNQIPVEIVTVNQNKISQSLTGSARKPDIILYNSVEMEQLYSIFLYSKWSKCPKVLELNCLKGVSVWRQRNFPKESGFIHEYDSQASPKQLQDLFQGQQLSSILRSDYYFCANDYISDYLRRKLKFNNYIINSIGVPTMEFLKEINELQFRQFRHRKDFAFLGSFTSKKNIQMINILINQIWPLIRNQIKGVQLYVYGSGYNKTLFSKKKQLEKIGIFLKGFVEDTQEIQRHRAVLYPIRTNCSLKGLISQAWFQHTPVITTPIGAEGYFLQTSQPRYSALADGKTFSGFFKERQLSKEQIESEKIVKDYYSLNKLSESINKLTFGGACNSFSYQQFATNAIKIYTDEQFWQSCLLKSRKSLLKNQSEMQLQTNIRFGMSQVQYSTFESRKKKQYSQQWSRYIKSNQAYNRLSQRKGKF